MSTFNRRNKDRAMAIADRMSQPLLALIAVINLLFVALFMMTVLAANAKAQDMVCSGENVLDMLQKDDPAAYADVVAEADATLNGSGLLYKVEKDGLAPSYLFGTMHMSDARVLDIPEKARDAFNHADIFVIETTEILDPVKSQTALLSDPSLSMFLGDERLSDYLNDEQRTVLSEGLKARGMQLALVDRMKPWLLTGMVALPGCEMARKAAGEPFLDIKLAADAKAQGKEILGLETIIEQFKAMAALPIEFHIEGLVQTIALGDKINDVNETMIQLYKRQSVAQIMPTLKKLSPPNAEIGDGYAEFEEKLVTNRNHIMAERAQPILEKGNAFIAVGALHLPGEEGVPNLLAKAGYTITPIR